MCVESIFLSTLATSIPPLDTSADTDRICPLILSRLLRAVVLISLSRYQLRYPWNLHDIIRAIYRPSNTRALKENGGTARSSFRFLYTHSCSVSSAKLRLSLKSCTISLSLANVLSLKGYRTLWIC